MHPRIVAAAIVLSFAGNVRAQDVKVYTGPPGPIGMAPAEQFVPDELIVVFDGPTAAQVATRAPQSVLIGNGAVDEVSRWLGVSNLRKQFEGPGIVGLPDLSGYYVIRFDAAKHTLDEALNAYGALPNVTHVEKIGIHPVYATPNDGNYSGQWHLNQANDKDIDAPEAWNVETGDPSITVAVLDTGVRYYHKDLGGSNASSSNPTAADGNMWINVAEKNGVPGVDDDGNGYVDDWVGYDFVTGVTGCSAGEDCSGVDNDPRDFNGHGTHCAGNVGAINNNGYATCSPSGGWGNGTLQPTANGVKVMALRIGYGTPSGGFVRMDFAASAFVYAANKGVKVASCSWGSSNSGGVAAALDTFIGAGGLVFVAAGNANNQTAGYLNSRADCYSVAATDQNDVRASFSSYGTWVDISAPGVSIVSLYHNSADPVNDYVATLSGTSMATPLTASAAAAVWSQNPTWTANQVWTRLRDTADNINAQNPSFVGLLGSGRLNLFNAVNTGGGNTAPTVTISSPANGTTVTSGTSVTFTGSASDAQDGNISASLVWTSNLQGQIGTGASFSRSDLVVGTHTITAQVTDSGGLSGSASITLTINAPANTPPTVTISSPANGTTVTSGTAVTFTGSASDAQDGNISASLVWSSNLQGQIGTGASFTRNDLVVGTHTITAQATDSGGLSGSASITLTVQSTTPQPPAPPSNAVAVKIASLTARVTWTDNANNETGFDIQRERRVGNAWGETTIVGSVGANVTTFTNTVTIAGKYRYRVRAFNGAGSSAFSNWAQVNLNN